ncbi:D-amino-acid dehydrogenase [Neisseria sp. HSC-16F19]|nr:D-amino-acid dehydrogenase [Neisseria sp. HSC-16F19]
MKVLVMGAGVVGVSTAWYLAKAGHEVTVIDRAADVAEETSFANAGQLSYGYTTPWAAPGIPKKALKWLFRPHSPLLLRPDGSLFQLQWLGRMLLNCTEKNYAQNKARMVRVSEYSRAMLQELHEELPDLDYEGRQHGTLQIFRTDKEVAAAQADVRVLQDYGVPVTVISNPQQCLDYEPALAGTVDKLAGALHLPNDATGDCHLFTVRLAEQCRALGVNFLLNHTINQIERDGSRIRGVIANGQRFEADHYVCALGSFSRTMLKSLDMSLPVYPVKGYSITVPVSNSDGAPQSTVLDETYKVAITRFKDRMRVGGMAELSGYKIQLNPKRRETLELVVNELFPTAGNVAEATFWSGLRPMTPDSTPLIGATRYGNLWLNTGHGTLGWTMGLGSGRVLSDLISGVTPEIESSDLSVIRYV